MKKFSNEKLIILIVGISLFLITLFAPDLLEQWRRSILDGMENCIWQGDKGLLMLAASQVIAYNAILMFPYIGGTFVLAHAFTLLGFPRFLRYGLPIFLAILFHYITFKQLDYPLPLATLGLVTLLGGGLAWRTHLGQSGLAPLVLIPSLIVLAVNSLSIAPSLSGYGLTVGDLTWETVLAGNFLDGSNMLNSMGITFFVILLIMAIISSELIALYNRRLTDVAELSRYQLESQRAHFQAQELRVLREMHTLVHDLKTPLMTVQGLNSLLEMAIKDTHLQDYTRRIEKAVDNLNKMISEILYDDVRKEVSVDELIKYVRAHVLVKTAGQKITFHLDQNLPLLEVNLIRIARALINLIENAFTATSTVKNGRIEVRVESNLHGQVLFTVTDNGIGIPEHLLDDIWSSGFSTKASSGLGLGFVKRVVENHFGKIEIESQPGQGTRVRVVIPGVYKIDENLNH